MLRSHLRGVHSVLRAHCLILAVLSLPWHRAAGTLKSPAGITHVVLLTLENRSFDHFLGWLKTAEGPTLGTCLSVNTADPASRKVKCHDHFVTATASLAA